MHGQQHITKKDCGVGACKPVYFRFLEDGVLALKRVGIVYVMCASVVLFAIVGHCNYIPSLERDCCPVNQLRPPPISLNRRPNRVLEAPAVSTLSIRHDLCNYLAY
jgi:hypothetical protein